LIIFYFGNKPKIHKKISQEDLKKFLEVLLYRGYENGFMVIQVPTDRKFKRFIQFSKYIVDNRNVGLEFNYPLSEWSQPYYKKLKDILIENRIKFEIENTGHEKIPEFLVIDVKQNLDMANKISKLVFNDLYEIGKEGMIELYYHNISPREEKIGF
jgi:hypothetical protein